MTGLFFFELYRPTYPDAELRSIEDSASDKNGDGDLAVLFYFNCFSLICYKKKFPLDIVSFLLSLISLLHWRDPFRFKLPLDISNLDIYELYNDPEC